MKYTNLVMKRVIFDIGLLISVLVLPWWITFIFLFIGIFAFNQYYEFIIIGAIMFAIYSPLEHNLFSSPIFFSGIVIVLYVSIQLIRNNIILYKK
jgi:hypothetical protein